MDVSINGSRILAPRRRRRVGSARFCLRLTAVSRWFRTRLYGPGRPLRADKQPAAAGATAGDGGRVLPLY